MGCALRRIWRVLPAGILLLALEAAAVEPADAGLPASSIGRSIYQDGLGAHGEPVRATAQKGVTLVGAMAACANCHRRSGLGGSEGQAPIRAIAGRLLFSDGKPDRGGGRAMPASGAALRPAYTLHSLARALREGIDPAGQALDPLMPRYQLSDEELVQVHAYLQGLSADAAPGVTDREIHFSTILAPGASAESRDAMLDVMQGFFHDKNGGTRKETRRREVGSEGMYRAFRTWVLHVWELQGAPATWGAQLEAHYRRQPVFAVVGGVGDSSSWQPVHAFCEAFEVPCVFPDVDLPDVASAGHYTLYFSRGLALEAEVLARHLLSTDADGGSGTIVQVYRDDAPGRLPARVMREYLQGRSGMTIIDNPLAEGSRLPDGFPATLLAVEPPVVLVAWLDKAGLEAIGLAAAPPAGMAAIYASASLSAMRRPVLPEEWLGKLRMVYPFDLPASRGPRLARLHAWLRARKIPPGSERTQANTFFAATITGDAMSHLGENYSRDYFIERIEQMTQTALAPSIYPHLSLGPGQRYASRGGYVIRFLPGEEGTPVAISGWLVP